MKKIYIAPLIILAVLALSLSAFTPAYAQCAPGRVLDPNTGACVPVEDAPLCAPRVEDIGDAICVVSKILRSILPVLLALGVVYFVWGVVTYVIGSDEEAKSRGRNRIIFGIIGLAVILSLWGLVGILVNTFGLNNSGELATGFIQETQSIVAGSDTCSLGTDPKLSNLLNYATCILNESVVPLLFALAILMFVWGVIQFFILGAGEEAKRTQGKQFMIWGIVAIAVMVSVWGLVGILRNTFGIDNYIPQVAPR